MKLKELFKDAVAEDSSYEWKAKLSESEPLKWAKTLVGFANGEGGYLFVGVSNDGEAFGLPLEEIDKTKNLIALVNDRHIFPHVSYSLSSLSVDLSADRFVLAVKVRKSDSIVRYRDGDFAETVYVKGDANAIPARPEEIIDLSRRKLGVDGYVSDVVYDPMNWNGYLSMCQTYRSDGGKPSLKELQSLNLVDKNGFATGGLLMFKDDYEGEDTRIHCRLYKGPDKGFPVMDRAEYRGSLAHCFLSASNFIDRNTRHGYYKTKTGRIDVDSYPPKAIQEALVNAIAHRDYSIRGTQIDVNIFSDHMDITSPGCWLLPKPYGEYALGDIPSIRRNELICACFDLANLMERGGSGFKAIFDAYKGADESKKPQVISYDSFFIIRFFDLQMEEMTPMPKAIHIEVAPKDSTEKVLEALSSKPMKVRELQEIAGYSSRSRFLVEVINPLIEEGKIERVGSPKSPSSYLKLK